MKHFKRMDSINIVPFIDIMLVLLVIVLTSATFIAQGKIPITLPKSEGSQKIDKPLKEVEITINAKGEYFLDKTPLSLESLKQEVLKLPQDSPILLRGDSKSAFESFISVVGVLQESGRMNIDIQVQRE
ncbi:MAG: biopolymer transporter ExbD [Helicobacter sp.]|nr:biopolymer transporter ExbD [Helicobacter sp.]